MGERRTHLDAWQPSRLLPSLIAGVGLLVSSAPDVVATHQSPPVFDEPDHQALMLEAQTGWTHLRQHSGDLRTSFARVEEVIPIVDGSQLTAGRTTRRETGVVISTAEGRAFIGDRWDPDGRWRERLVTVDAGLECFELGQVVPDGPYFVRQGGGDAAYRRRVEARISAMVQETLEAPLTSGLARRAMVDLLSESRDSTKLVKRTNSTLVDLTILVPTSSDENVELHVVCDSLHHWRICREEAVINGTLSIRTIEYYQDTDHVSTVETSLRSPNQLTVSRLAVGMPSRATTMPSETDRSFYRVRSSAHTTRSNAMWVMGAGGVLCCAGIMLKLTRNVRA